MEEKLKILLTEDDTNLGRLLKEYLEAKDYEVTLATNGKEGFEFFKKQRYDLCLLDVMMPVKDGITLAKEIRSINPDVPVVFLTAKTMKEDTIEGFKAGADDYITKPFSMEELLLRLKAIFKRTNAQAISQNNQNEFEIGRYHFNYQTQTLEIDGKKQKLTSKESDLLKLLSININNVLDRSFALNSIWNDDSYFNSRSMDVYIAKLRKYLSEDIKVEIVNVHGKGFKLLVNK